MPAIADISGIEGLSTVASKCDYDIFIGAMVGSAGLSPTIQAIKRGKRIALANKETLVVAGELVTQLAELYGAEILPVDSEHSAIFQCLTGENIAGRERLDRTAVATSPASMRTSSPFRISAQTRGRKGFHPGRKYCRDRIFA